MHYNYRMKFLFLLLVTFSVHAQTSAEYKVLPGTLHRSGKVIVSILPTKDKYEVRMDYDVRRKEFVPVPSKLLKGNTVMAFPQIFRTEKGYQELEKQKRMTIPKAELRFVKRADYKHLKNAYFIEVHPTNKKTKIDIIYHPTLPSVGWARVQITFISNIPILNGYELVAEVK